MSRSGKGTFLFFAPNKDDIKIFICCEPTMSTTFLFTSESVNEGHPGKDYLLMFQTYLLFRNVSSSRFHEFAFFFFAFYRSVIHPVHRHSHVPYRPFPALKNIRIVQRHLPVTFSPASAPLLALAGPPAPLDSTFCGREDEKRERERERERRPSFVDDDWDLGE
jgi:hypothetical protein